MSFKTPEKPDSQDISLSFTLNWSEVEVPEIVDDMTPRAIVESIRMNLLDTAEKIEAISHRKGQGSQPESELFRIADELRRIFPAE